jgi:hypothetical protein
MNHSVCGLLLHLQISNSEGQNDDLIKYHILLILEFSNYFLYFTTHHNIILCIEIL